MLSFIICAVIEWFGSFTSGEAVLGTVFATPHITGVMVEQARLTIITVALVLGAVMAKAVDGTIRNTLRPAIMVILALISLLVAPGIVAQIFHGI